MAHPQKMFVTGFVTRERWIIGKTPREMESLLGFRPGRMAQGAGVYALDRLPQASEFDFAGYTHLPSGMSISEAAAARSAGTTRSPQQQKLRALIDIDKTKKTMLNSWTLVGRERLVKVVPVLRLEPESYPPGDGVEQWKLLNAVPATLVRQPLGPNEVYDPYGNP